MLMLAVTLADASNGGKTVLLQLIDGDYQKKSVLHNDD